MTNSPADSPHHDRLNAAIFIAIDGQRQGPFALEQLKTVDLRPDMLV